MMDGAQIARDGPPPPRWATIAACLVPLVVLPSALWRVMLIFGFSMGTLRDGQPFQPQGAESLYIIGLTLVTEGFALLTLGLVRPWGERLPGRTPLFGGRRIPPRPVAVIASTGALLLALILAIAFQDFPETPEMEFADTAWHAVMVACYLPLLFWPPLLGAVTYSYHRRHRDLSPPTHVRSTHNPPG